MDYNKKEIQTINTKVYALGNYFKKGIYNEDMLRLLVKRNFITEEEFNEIISNSSISYMDVEKSAEIYDIPYEYEVWDKITPINGVPAHEVIKDLKMENAQEIILTKKLGRVLEINDIDTLKINYNLNPSAEAEEIAQTYANMRTTQENEPVINTEELKTAMTLFADVEQSNSLEEIKVKLNSIEMFMSNIKGDLSKLITVLKSFKE